MSSSSSEAEDRGVAPWKGGKGKLGITDDNEWEQDDASARENRISDMLGEEIAAGAAPTRTVNGERGDKEENTDAAGSDFGDFISPSHTPLRDGSPVDSMLSIPDDTPSIQVRTSICGGVLKLIMKTGFRYVLSRKQRLTIDGFTANVRQSYTFL